MRTFDVSWDGKAPWEPVEAPSAVDAVHEFMRGTECAMDGDQVVFVKGYGRYLVTEVKGNNVVTRLPDEAA